jgi:hypothetical protein
MSTVSQKWVEAMADAEALDAEKQRQELLHWTEVLDLYERAGQPSERAWRLNDYAIFLIGIGSLVLVGFLAYAGGPA